MEIIATHQTNQTNETVFAVVLIDNDERVAVRFLLDYYYAKGAQS
jgi:hypothetical protein